MKINYVNVNKQFIDEKKHLIKILTRILSKESHVGGDEISKFEKNISKVCKKKYTVALNSGTDALTLSLHLLGVKRGDEVITPPNSFVASTASIIHLGAKPVFVDVKNDQNINENLIEEKISKKTKAIMPVHLTGRMCNMEQIIKISKKYGIPVVEDSAQSILSKYKNIPAGSWGDIGCFSAHPLKNLNAMGDGGYLTTNNRKIFEKSKSLRTHGMIDRNKVKDFGHVSRLDTIQAAVLNFRLKKLNDIIKKRRRNFLQYKSLLNRDHVFFPLEKKEEFNTYHTFVVQVDKRDELKKYLNKNGISTAIHYPIPIHLQPAYKKIFKDRENYPNTEKQAKRILTLPINQYLNNSQIAYICKKINSFYK